jgi:mannan endo-1,4-beta-mannosidase
MKPGFRAYLASRLGSRLILLVAITISAAAVASTGAHFSLLPSPPPAHAPLPRSVASYVGVFEEGVPPGYEPVAAFARATHKHPNLVGYYSGWAEPFASSFAERIHKHGAFPYVQIDPNLASVSAIANGRYDIYLRTYADSVRDFAHAVVIGFGHEMNASWYSWGYGHVPPATFVAAWRHIVKVFHHEGADNVTWLWTINQDVPGTGPIRSWWPGAKYVTWVGIDGYYFRPSDTFTSVFGHTIDHLRKFTDKPVLLSETAVAPHAGPFPKIGDLFLGMRRYNTLGLVWFDIPQSGGFRQEDWHLEDNREAVLAFRLGISRLTLARPSG